MKWIIVTDSGCDGGFTGDSLIDCVRVPFTINIETREYTDDETLDVKQLLHDMEHSREVMKSACPSPKVWYEAFCRGDFIIAVTISASLSGSYNSAVTAKKMCLEKYPDKKIFVLDSKSAGAGQGLLTMKAAEYIHDNMEYEAVIDKLSEMTGKMHTIFALSSFNNLIRNGRISRFSGTVAGRLGIWGIGIGDGMGRIAIKAKVRGTGRMIKHIIDDIKTNGLSTDMILISHCDNEETAAELKYFILEHFTGIRVCISETGGLCSSYAERGGIIVAY